VNVHHLPRKTPSGLHRPTWHPDFSALARSRVAAARAQAGLSVSDFADELSRLLGRPIAAGHVHAWETRTTPPGDVILALSSLAPTATPRLGVRSHKFIATQIGATRIPQLADRMSAQRVDGLLGKVPCWSSAIDGVGQECTLIAWPFGSVIIHLVEELDLPDITSLALWRYESYPEHLRWASEYLGAQLGDESVSAAYILSAYWVHSVPWVGATLDTALRLICSPRVLVDRDPGDLAAAQVAAERVEQDLLSSDYQPTKMVSFGVPGVSSGYASWSGVVYHPHDPLRALAEADLVTAEVVVQAIWSYTGHINDQCEAGIVPSIGPSYGHQFLRSVRSRLLTARPQETGPHHQMREAIVTTSGLPGQIELAMENLREVAR